ncbi:MAG: bifunctional 2-polyprenyl-6-hydroxyphenol methylase/3-demethylubiquinol 3-O-methyltransferase UbiG [Defluviicoccus sp.]|nr:bifunctional 2-polyprenyl-6-hydroxyphenol methylase/3-demethylubiquinol 3-O-methyltransferase UbiG [Defluviicoccus sp.]
MADKQPKQARVDEAEVARFSALADAWWDPEGEFRPLHKLNPVRMRYIRDALCAANGRAAGEPVPLSGMDIVDVGCGGGLLCEPLARLGARVTGIDPSARNVEIAANHAARAGLEIAYRVGTVEDLVAEGRRFDAVLALEVVEHVPDLRGFVAACVSTAGPDARLFFATLNRTPQSFLLGIVAAEYVLGWLPRGTHDWRRFVRPSELARALEAGGATLSALDGVRYDVLTDDWRVTPNVSVNYMAMAEPARG